MTDGEHSIANSVMTARLTCERLDLDELAASLPYVRFEPDIYMGAILKIDGTTIIAFANGKLTCTGKTPIKAMKKALRKFTTILNETGIGHNIRIKRGSVRVENIVSVVNAGGPIDLESMSRTQPRSTTYEPEQFPALTWRRTDCVVQVFGTGNLTVTGVKDEEALGSIQNSVVRDIQRFIIIRREGSGQDSRNK